MPLYARFISMLILSVVTIAWQYGIYCCTVFYFNVLTVRAHTHIHKSNTAHEYELQNDFNKYTTKPHTHQFFAHFSCVHVFSNNLMRFALIWFGPSCECSSNLKIIYGYQRKKKIAQIMEYKCLMICELFQRWVNWLKLSLPTDKMTYNKSKSSQIELNHSNTYKHIN